MEDDKYIYIVEMDRHKLLEHIDALEEELRLANVHAWAEEAENARLRAALEQIAAPSFGLQGLVEDGASEHEISEYHASEWLRMQRIAREALEETP